MIYPGEVYDASYIGSDRCGLLMNDQIEGSWLGDCCMAWSAFNVADLFTNLN